MSFGSITKADLASSSETPCSAATRSKAPRRWLSSDRSPCGVTYWAIGLTVLLSCGQDEHAEATGPCRSLFWNGDVLWPAVSVLSSLGFLELPDLPVCQFVGPVDYLVQLGKRDIEGVGRSPYGQDVFGFSATAEIDREDFGITYNMALEAGGVMISKTVKIEIEGEAIRQADAA